MVVSKDLPIIRNDKVIYCNTKGVNIHHIQCFKMEIFRRATIFVHIGVFIYVIVDNTSRREIQNTKIRFSAVLLPLF